MYMHLYYRAITLTLLHSEGPKLYSERNRVKAENILPVISTFIVIGCLYYYATCVKVLYKVYVNNSLTLIFIILCIHCYFYANEK